MEVEAGAASVLSPLGFTKDSVAIGDVVTVSGNPSRNNADTSLLGKDLYKKDGAYFPLNIGSRSVYTGKDEVAKSLAGTWFPPRTEFNGFLGGARSWQVTDKGKAAMSVVDPKATTQKDCIPIGAPALMFYPVANTITVQKDRVVMKVDWMDSERTIYIDGRKHPPATETSFLGHSVGRWEGERCLRDHKLQRTSDGPFHFTAQQHAETPDRTLPTQSGRQKPDLFRRDRGSSLSGKAGRVDWAMDVQAEHASLE